MQKQERFEKFVRELESKKHDIQHSDFRFYNLAHFPLIFKRSSECSHQCSVCHKNLEILELMVKEIPGTLNQFKDRKVFEQQKNKIESHLKKEHKFHFPGYYAAKGALIGFLISLSLVIILNYGLNIMLPNKLNILSIGLGLLIGWFAGTAKDRKIFRKNMQL